MAVRKIVCTVTNDLNYDQRMIRICTSLAGAGYDVTLVGIERKTSKPPYRKTIQAGAPAHYSGTGKTYVRPTIGSSCFSFCCSVKQMFYAP